MMAHTARSGATSSDITLDGKPLPEVAEQAAVATRHHTTTTRIKNPQPTPPTHPPEGGNDERPKLRPLHRATTAELLPEDSVRPSCLRRRRVHNRSGTQTVSSHCSPVEIANHANGTLSPPLAVHQSEGAATNPSIVSMNPICINLYQVSWRQVTCLTSVCCVGDPVAICVSTWEGSSPFSYVSSVFLLLHWRVVLRFLEWFNWMPRIPFAFKCSTTPCSDFDPMIPWGIVFLCSRFKCITTPSSDFFSEFPWGISCFVCASSASLHLLPTFSVAVPVREFLALFALPVHDYTFFRLFPMMTPCGICLRVLLACACVLRPEFLKLLQHPCLCCHFERIDDRLIQVTMRRFLISIGWFDVSTTVWLLDG